MIWTRLIRPNTPYPLAITYDPGTMTGIALWAGGRLAGVKVLGWDVAREFCRNVAREGAPWQTAQHIIEAPDHVRTVSTDMLINAARAGEIKGITGGSFVGVKQWKGTAPKSATETWARQALLPDEFAHVGKISHHGWDAIALGLWYHHRLTPNQG